MKRPGLWSLLVFGVAAMGTAGACNLFAGTPCNTDDDCAADEGCRLGFCIADDDDDDDDPVDGGATSCLPEPECLASGVPCCPPDGGVPDDDGGVADNDAGVADDDAGVADAGVAEPERCDDGVDNDGDGDVDCGDVDCGGSDACAPCTFVPGASGLVAVCGERTALAAAEARCADIGGHVVAIETGAERAVIDGLADVGLRWLGLSDAAVESEFRVTRFPGRPPAVRAFVDGQPDNGVGVATGAGGTGGVDAGPEVDAGPGDELDAGPGDELDAGPGEEVDAGPGDDVDAGPVDAGDPDFPPPPSGTDEDCVVGDARGWADVPCAGEDAYAVVCEVPARRWSSWGLRDQPPDDLAGARTVATPDDDVFLVGGTIGGVLAPSAWRLELDERRVVALPPPAARSGHVAALVGDQLVVWGGSTAAGASNTGQRFVPAAQQWVDLPTLSAPAPATSACGVALGRALFVFGGRDASGAPTADGGLYLLDEDRWIDLPAAGRPTARAFHACEAIDTSRVFIWGGSGAVDIVGRIDLRGDGAIFDLTSNSWQALPATGAPSARTAATAVVQRGHVLVFGGQVNGSFLREVVVVGGGALYDVAAGQWRPLPTGAPSARVGASALPAGDEILVFGGRNDSAVLADGALLDVEADRWRPLNPRQAPGPTVPFAVRAGRAHFWSLASVDRGAVYVVGDPAIDRDDDGLVDDHEAYLGTDPDDADSNNDGVGDGDAIAEGLPFLP